jgi:hypothetical protein
MYRATSAGENSPHTGSVDAPSRPAAARVSLAAPASSADGEQAASRAQQRMKLGIRAMRVVLDDE